MSELARWGLAITGIVDELDKILTALDDKESDWEESIEKVRKATLKAKEYAEEMRQVLE
jgi:septation ring formation regulator EzrA